MKVNKDLGYSVNGLRLKKYNIKLICSYNTTQNEKINKEAEIAIVSTDRETATNLAIEKAKKLLNEFSYIVKNSIIVEKKKREIKRARR